MTKSLLYFSDCSQSYNHFERFSKKFTGTEEWDSSYYYDISIFSLYCL